MIRFNRYTQRAALCALLLSFNLSAAADELQDANKLIKQGQHGPALVKIDAALVGKPKDAQARFLKAVILTEQGQTEEAIRLLTALTEDHPDLPEPYNNLAVIYAGQGQFEKAKVALEKALRTHPSYSTAHENLGDIYAKMASQAYDRALQLDRSKNSPATKLALLKEMHSPAAKTTTSKIQVASVNTLPTNTAPVNTVTAVPSTPAPIAASSPVVAASIEKPIATPAVTPTSLPTSNNAEVLNAVTEWAQAWSSRNVKQYLAMYAVDFKTPNNESRSNWEQQRRDRISKPQPIVVTVSNAKVKMLNDTQASVSFVQFYRSGTLNSTTLKTLEMRKTNGMWKIQSELSGKK